MSKLELQAINAHVHLRDFGENYKETIKSGTKAALAGGFVAVLDMPNNQPPVLDLERLEKKIAWAKENALCHYGAYVAGTRELRQIGECSLRACGLKIYMDATHGQLLTRDLETLNRLFESWPRHKPICVHAEDMSVAAAIGLAEVYNKSLHICHVSTEEEILLIRRAKELGTRVTCEVTPHHLLLNDEDALRLGAFGYVKPILKPKSDVSALWKNLEVIDCLVDDHAPHTDEEKRSDVPPPGLPGLETTLPLMLSAVAERRLSLEKMLDMVWFKPKQIFGIGELAGSYCVIDLEESYFVEEIEFQTKVAWSPYSGHRLTGRVRQAFVAGEKVYEDGKFIKAKPKISIIS